MALDGYRRWLVTRDRGITHPVSHQQTAHTQPLKTETTLVVLHSTLLDVSVIEAATIVSCIV